MVTIGFRVSPKQVTYAVLNAKQGDVPSVLALSEVVVPPALETPRQLQFVRTTLLDVMEEHGILRAGLRVVEGNAQQKNPFRLNMEGVVQELLASAHLERFIAGPIATIAAQLFPKDRSRVKRLIEGEETLAITGTLEWASLEKDQREAILMALAAASTLESHSGTAEGAS
jgi:hypothetical protein